MKSVTMYIVELIEVHDRYVPVLSKKLKVYQSLQKIIDMLINVNVQD